MRTAGEWKSNGILAGSTTLTFFDEAGRANPPQWLEQLKHCARPDQPLILICRRQQRNLRRGQRRPAERAVFASRIAPPAKK